MKKIITLAIAASIPFSIAAMEMDSMIPEEVVQAHVETTDHEKQVDQVDQVGNFHDVIIDNDTDSNYFMVFQAIHCTNEFKVKTTDGARSYTNVCGTAMVKSHTEYTYHASYDHPEDHRRMWVDYWPISNKDNAKNVLFITRRNHTNWCGATQGMWDGFICSSALMIEED